MINNMAIFPTKYIEVFRNSNRIPKFTDLLKREKRTEREEIKMLCSFRELLCWTFKVEGGDVMQLVVNLQIYKVP